MNRFYRTLTIVILLTTVVTSVLSASGGKDNDGTLTILATTSMVGDVVRNIAGDFQSIEGLIPQGGNPHNYEPTPRHMALVEKADIIFVNGLGLEESLLETLENVTDGRIVEVSATITPLDFEGEDDHGHEDDHGDEDDHDHGLDPHTWTSPLNVIAWTTVISEALAEADPQNAETYRKNAETYTARLIDLDKEARTAFSSIKEENKKLVSDHSIFGYFARDYGFKNLGALVPSFSTNSETSAGDLSELIEEINEHKIKAVFIGNTAGSSMIKLGEVLVEEADHPVKLLTIMTGSLSAPGEAGDTYLSYFEYNVNQIVEGLSE